MRNEEISLRDADIGDVAQITILINELGYPTDEAGMETRLQGIFNQPDYKTMVAVLNNEVVGMVGAMKGHYYEKNGQHMRILAFVVKQSCRRKGIGKILMNAAEQWAVEQGLHASLLTSGIRDERKDAYAFYQKSGYEIKSSGFVKEL